MKNDPSSNNQSGRKAKPLIYVVDDEPLLLELAATLLDPDIGRVQTYRNAESALAAFTDAKPRPDLVITDFAMHQMNGMKLILECRRLEPGQKIILTSGTVDESVYRNSPVKPNQFLAKPYQTRELIDAVQALLAA